MNRELGIDLGTSYIRICQRDKGIVKCVPMVVAVDRQSRSILAVGREAKRMIGKTPSQILAYKPMHSGAVADCDILPRMLNAFMATMGPGMIYSRPNIVVGVPHGATEVERRALENAIFEAGAKSVALAEEPVAAAVGAGVRMNTSKGNMVVDIGGGTTEVTLLSMGGIVRSQSLRLGGDDLDDSIIRFLKEEKQLLIGDLSAERLKKEIGVAHSSISRGTMDIHGRDLKTRLIVTREISSSEIWKAIQKDIHQIKVLIKTTLEESPPELAGDIYDHGIVLCGGMALLPGLDREIADYTHVRVTVARQPLDCTAIGIGKMLEGVARDGIQYRTR